MKPQMTDSWLRTLGSQRASWWSTLGPNPWLFHTADEPSLLGRWTWVMLGSTQQEGVWLPHLMTHILGGIQAHLPTSRPEQQSLPHQPRQLGCRPQDTWRKRPGPGPGPPGGRGMWSFSTGSGWQAEGSAAPPAGGSSMAASPSLV